MALDLSAAAWIRAGSGLLYLALGLFLFTVRPRRRANVWLALCLGCFGLRFIVISFVITDVVLAPYGFAISVALDAGMAAALVAFLRGAALTDEGPRRVWRGGFLLAAVFILVGGVLAFADRAALTAASSFPASVRHLYPVDLVLRGGFLSLAAVLFAVEIERWRAGPSRQGSARLHLLLAFLLYGAYDLSSSIKEASAAPMGAIGYVLCEGMVVVAAFWCFRATGRGRLPRNAMLLLVAALVAGAIMGGTLGAQDFVGAIGIVRTLGFLLVVRAVFRLDLLGVPIPKLALRTGALASIGLASLLITAQVAQNFLSAEFGLLIGGIVAGAAVFVAFPLQRAAEKALERRKSDNPSGALGIYQAQVELAWKDGRLGANERMMLRDLRVRLGLGAEQAEQVDNEVAAGHAAQGRRSKRGA